MPTEHQNQLSENQLEILALISEEAGEVVQIVGKILRHGLYSYHPDNPGVSNAMMLEREIGDLIAAVNLAFRDRVLLEDSVERHIRNKSQKFRDHPELLHHVRPLEDR